jgi:amidohydrolase
MRQLLAITAALSCVVAHTAESLQERAAKSVAALQPRIVEWRRDVHRNPELSNREFRTSKLAAEHLRRLGMNVETGIAHTGVVGVLRGGRPGKTIMLRADMDALPVKEQTDLPFKSTATDTYRGETVGVMHACGHDAHVAILMAVAEALSPLRAELPGTIIFLFQPAEEGAPAGEEGGAELMLKQGLFDKYKPDAAFALHVGSDVRVGELGYRAGAFSAASDAFRILVRGRQTHGARPWQGVDPIVTAAQIINSMQTIVSRQTDITENPAVVTVGAIKGGIRNNIIPDEVEMIGTVRSFEPAQRAAMFERLRVIVENVSTANGATGTLSIDSGGNPVTLNNAALTAQMAPTLKRVAGADRVRVTPQTTGAEDFAFFARRVPSFYFRVGVTPPGESVLTAPANHSPLFYIDEAALPLGAQALAAVALDYLTSAAQR